jgi:hypothetical protein
MPEFPRAHTEAVWLFNHGWYYGAHERWESLWLKEPVGPKRVFYQMLIHAAVCLHHWARGNRMGLVLQWRQFDQKAEAFPRGIHWGINVSLLRSDLSVMVEPIVSVDNLELPSFNRYPLPELVLVGLEPMPVDEPPRQRHCRA